MRDRNPAFQSQQHRRTIHRRVGRTQAVDFFNALTGRELLEITEAHLPEHRERLYPPTVTLSMFMKQVLEEDSSCQRAVNSWVAQRIAEGLSPVGVGTGAYCRARQRLPLEMVRALTQESGQMLSQRAAELWTWRGRTVKLVDGTVVSMPDTPENQASFPQPTSQAEGVGFPLARLVAVICLSTGAVLDAAIGAFAGKGNGELGLFRRLSEGFMAGDVMLADALFCNYFLIATLQAAGVDVLFEQHGARVTDFRRGHKLGERDHVVCWPKPENRPPWMSREQYQSFPDEITVREARVDGQVLVTTMLNARDVPKGELGELYRRRWCVELDLRNVKTTLGMAIMSCKTPQMNQKEMWVYLLAYNLIRLLMAQAALAAGLHPRRLSFKHTVQIWTAWTARRLNDPEQHHAVLLKLIAQRKVGNRPGRIEPRARKRRRKPYPSLQVPRAQAREQIRIHGHQ